MHSHNLLQATSIGVRWTNVCVVDVKPSKKEICFSLLSDLVTSGDADADFQKQVKDLIDGHLYCRCKTGEGNK